MMLKRPLLLMLDRHALLLVFANRMASRQALCWDRREGVSPPLFLSGISADLGARVKRLIFAVVEKL